MVDAVGELHRAAGRPSLRRVAKAILENDRLRDTASHEVIGRLLRGDAIPTWPKLDVIVRTMAMMAVPRRDPDQIAQQFLQLWTASQDSRSAWDDEVAAPQHVDLLQSHEALVARRLEVESGRDNELMALTEAGRTASVATIAELVLKLGAGSERPRGDARSRSGFGDRVLNIFFKDRSFEDVQELLASLEGTQSADVRLLMIRRTAGTRHASELAELLQALRSSARDEDAFQLLRSYVELREHTSALASLLEDSGSYHDLEVLRALVIRFPQDRFGV